jgi:hypothetical protein
MSLDTLRALTSVIGILGATHGQRVLVLTSPGFLTLALRDETQSVIEAAVRANVMINSLDSTTLTDANGEQTASHPFMVTPLSDLALGTGGNFIYNVNDLARGMRALGSAPSVSYVLGFSPNDLKIDGKAHALQVKLTQPEHLTVHARPQYFAPNPKPTVAEVRYRRLQDSVLSTDMPSEIGAQVATTQDASAGDERALHVSVHVDMRTLPFADLYDKRKLERLIFITALFDSENHFMSGVEQVMELRLTEASWKKVREQGLDARAVVQAPPGSYRLRQVVQEEVDGKLVALNRQLDVR